MMIRSPSIIIAIVVFGCSSPSALPDSGVDAAAIDAAVDAGADPVQDGPPYPRVINYYLHGYVNPALIPSLARWNVLVVNTAWTRAQLQQLRALNPAIRIFPYLCAYCTSAAPPPVEWELENYNYAAAHDLWWYRGDQTIASDWPNTRMINITELGFAAPSGTWREYIAARVEALMTAVPEYDGVFYDNFWKQISWEQPSIRVKSDCNPTHNPGGCGVGLMDDNATLDGLWNRALRALAEDTRARFDTLAAQRSTPLAVISNTSTDYFPWLNGTLSEVFPSGGSSPDYGNPYGYNWNRRMLAYPGGYLVAPFSDAPYSLQMINAQAPGTDVAPTRTANFERHKRFTLASTLMGDGYYSLDASPGHGAIWWEPELDHDGRGTGYLGYPIGPMTRIGVATGAESITNASFSSDTSSWVGQAGAGVIGTFAHDTTAFYSAPASARVEVQSVTGTGSFKVYQTVSVTANRGYTLSFWASSSVEQNLDLHLYSTVCPSGRCLGDWTVRLQTGWHRYDVSFVSTGTDPSAGLDLFLSAPGTVWFDDVSLREGDSAVYRRDFDHGIVLLNYTTTTQQVDLGGTFARLDIAGSPVFDGAQVTTESIPPSDARILMR